MSTVKTRCDLRRRHWKVPWDFSFASRVCICFLLRLLQPLWNTSEFSCRISHFVFCAMLWLSIKAYGFNSDPLILTSTFFGGDSCLIDSQYSYQCYNLLSLFLPKGIFPASYIHLKEAIVEGKGWVFSWCLNEVVQWWHLTLLLFAGRCWGWAVDAFDPGWQEFRGGGLLI